MQRFKDLSTKLDTLRVSPQLSSMNEDHSSNANHGPLRADGVILSCLRHAQTGEDKVPAVRGNPQEFPDMRHVQGVLALIIFQPGPG